MNLPRTWFSAALLIFIAVTAVSCGMDSSSGRMLVSISVSPAAVTVQNTSVPVQFVATGTFSAPPITVSPLPVQWKGSWYALSAICEGGKEPACEGINPQTGLALCGGIPPDVTITASAPADPSLPLDSKSVAMASGTATLKC